jgi:two-component system, sensor histidine kinase PdtaS
MLNLISLTLVTRTWPTWLRYLTTVLIVLATLLVRSALQSGITDNVPGSPFLLFFLAIIISSVLFDHGTGVFAVFLSALLSKWFFIAPIGSLVAAGPELLGLFFFVVIGLITAGIAEALHRVAADLTKANKRLIALEADRSVQLAEASHRFKNELAILSSLLRLELRHVADPDARASLSSTSSRIRVIARLHDRLEIHDSAAAVIDTREFIHALCDDLTHAMIGMRPIDLKVEAERHLMPQELALMLGLIINEFVVNALKHAFPDERPGTIVVTFRYSGHEFNLTVADDGIGMIGPTGSDPGGQGQGLMKSLVSKLDGLVSVGPNSEGAGTVASVRFAKWHDAVSANELRTELT